MADYIEREAVYDQCGWYNTVNGKSICAARKDEIAAVPVADVAPVVHGRWVCLEPEIGLFSCSLCEHLILRAECNYCPNCGAKMDLEG